MIDIKISDKLKIVSDVHNFALAKKVFNKKEVLWQPFEWYDNLDYLIEELFKRHLRTLDVNNLEELTLSLENTKDRYLAVIRELKEALK